MAVVLYRSDKTTLLDGYAITNESAGTDSDTVTVWIINTGNTTAKNVVLIQQTFDPIDSAVAKSSGLPPQDQMWGRFKVTDFDNVADPTFIPSLTDYVPMGAYGGVLLGDIPAGCGIKGLYRSHPPESADDGLAWTRSLRPVWDEFCQPIPAALGMVDRGVLTGIGDGSRRGVLAMPTGYARQLLDYMGMQITASGTPDDAFHVQPGVVLWDGRLSPRVATGGTLNQNDSAASALTSGQVYYAAISAWANGITTTKGLRGSSPTKPTAPQGEILLGYVRVRYQAGGTSIIDSTDVTDQQPARFLDRYFPRDGGGLSLSISSGQAIGGGTWRYSAGEQIVPLTDDDTNYVWQLATGLFTATTTDTLPETTALKFFEVDAASGAITEIRDCRTYAGETVTIELRGEPPTGAPGTIKSAPIAAEHLIIDPTRCVYWNVDVGTGTGGNFEIDLLQNGSTLFPSADDWRPVWAFDETYVLTWALPQVVDLYRGDILELASIDNPTGGNPPSEVVVELVCQKAAA